MPLHTAGLPLVAPVFFLAAFMCNARFRWSAARRAAFSGQQIRVDFPFALEYTGCSNRAVLYMAQVP